MLLLKGCYGSFKENAGIKLITRILHAQCVSNGWLAFVNPCLCLFKVLLQLNNREGVKNRFTETVRPPHPFAEFLLVPKSWDHLKTFGFLKNVFDTPIYFN